MINKLFLYSINVSNKLVHLLMYLVGNLGQAFAVLGAVFLALAGKDGWGWFLFLALFLGKGIKVHDSIDTGDEK